MGKGGDIASFRDMLAKNHGKRLNDVVHVWSCSVYEAGHAAVCSLFKITNYISKT
jgi:hypothetical protein